MNLVRKMSRTFLEHVSAVDAYKIEIQKQTTDIVFKNYCKTDYILDYR